MSGNATINVDGKLDEAAWHEAPVSPRFVDILTGGPVIHDTRAAVVWDDQYLYVSYRVEEPFVQAKFTNHNDTIYYDNDVELFVAGPDAYYEFEINPLGTVYEAFYIWQDAYRAAGFSSREEFDLTRGTVDVLGGFQDGSRFGKHPRGRRWAFMDWDFPGLRSAVRTDGTLNDDRDIDRGWTVELAFPWSGMATLAQGRDLPPRDGDVWRMDFSRFEALTTAGIRVRPDPGWALNRHGVYDSHIPECFSRVEFSASPAV